MRMIVSVLALYSSLFALENSKLLHLNLPIAKVTYTLSNGKQYDDKHRNNTIDLVEVLAQKRTLLAYFSPRIASYKQIDIYFREPKTIAEYTDANISVSLPHKWTLQSAFTLPKNAFYSMPIDLSTEKLDRLIQAKRMLPQQIRFEKLKPLYGIYYYTRPNTEGSFTLDIKPQGKVRSLLQKKPNWIVSGKYVYDTIAQTVQLMPSTAQCPKCSGFKNFFLRAIPIPDPVAYPVVAITPDTIHIINERKRLVVLHKTDQFRLYLK